MASAQPRKKIVPSSRACLPCRDKHLKCNGQTPVCDRCTSTGMTCAYIQSRRGRRGAPAVTTTAANTTTSAPVTGTAAAVGADVARPPSLMSNLVGLDELPTASALQLQNTATEPSEDTISMPHVDTNTPDDDYLIGLYYRYIHPAHPFLLPQKLYQHNRGLFPDHLKRAMCFIASHHSSTYPEQHRDASNAVFEPSVINDAFKVQSLILITLTSYARFERDRGNTALNAAIDVAHQIGLNSDTFGQDHEPLFRESWRRTWWELYTISGLISLIGSTNVRLSQPSFMTLPCDCEAYNTCQAPRTGNVEDIRERFRAEAPTKWSSFAYRVEAMRILSMVLDAAQESTSSRTRAAEAAVSSWLLSLPEEKREGLKDDGEVDEVMSCALMIIHLASICLHLPQSPLAHAGDFRTVCGNNFCLAASETPRLHHVAALRSAKALARLLTSHATLSTLSPCFSCAIAFSAVVLLSEYSTHIRARPEDISENLQLELSALQSLGQTWPIARVVRGQIAGFARDVMGRAASNSQAEGLADLGLPSADDLWLQDLIGETAMLPE